MNSLSSFFVILTSISLIVKKKKVNEVAPMIFNNSTHNASVLSNMQVAICLFMFLLPKFSYGIAFQKSLPLFPAMTTVSTYVVTVLPSLFYIFNPQLRKHVLSLLNIQ